MKQEVAKLGVQYRFAEVERAKVTEDRTVEVAFSSETPVERWWGTEILDHSPKSVRMDRMQSGGAVLANHDMKQHIGVVESARIDSDHVGRAVVRFGKSPLAEEKYQDVKDGILRHISVGYMVHKIETTTDGKGQNEVDRVTDWEPVEISFVAVPADPTVGVGRSAESAEFPVEVHRQESNEVQIPAAEAVMETRNMETNSNAPAATAVVTENNYGPVAADIVRLGKQYNVDVTDFVARQATVAEAKEIIADMVLARAKEKQTTSGVATPVTENLTEKERKDYSIVRAIRALAGEGEAGLEMEVSKEISKRLGTPSKGLYIPTRLRAGLDTKTDAAGKYTVMTEVRDLIELLRNKTRVIQMGATVLSGLDSNVSFPVHATAPTITWVAENPGSDLTDADSTFGARSLTPKMASMSTSYSRKLLAQSSIDVEAFVRNDLATGHALGIDLAAINGLGSSNQPLGLLKTSGIGDVAIGTNGGVPTYDVMVDLETAIATANADAEGMKFLTTPGIRGKLRKTQQFSSTNGVPVWQQLGNSLGVGDVLGYPGYVSNQVPSTLTKGNQSLSHAIIFGYWPAMLIGEWGVIEIVVDPYSKKKQGMIEVTSYQMVDVLLRQPAQFAACQDATLS